MRHPEAFAYALRGVGIEDVAVKFKLSRNEAKQIVWAASAVGSEGGGKAITSREASEILCVEESTVCDLGRKGILRTCGKRGHWHLYERKDVEVLAAGRKARAERLKERKRKWRVRT